MEIDFQKVNVEQLTIVLQNDLNAGTSELKTWGEIVTILYKEAGKAGFKKLFNRTQIEFINELYDQFVADYTQNVNNLGSNLTYVNEDE
jgi:hypothetical protein